ncbi:MAG: ATP-binding cassette domain-containing protein, partial [Pseudomonadales bacterium]
MMGDDIQTPTAITAKNIVKRYALGPEGGVEVLQGLNLTVQSGEHIAITGASGSGKSTLLHILAGLELPDSGTVWLNGQQLASLSELEQAR